VLGIYDLYGRNILQRNIHIAKTQTDISGFAKGIYLISVSTKYHSKTMKLIVD